MTILLTLLLLPHSTHGFDIRQPYSGYQRGCVVAPHPLSSNDYSYSYKIKIRRRGYSKSTLLFEQHSSRQEGNDEPSFRVGIVGAGSISFGTASLTSSLGHIPMIWSPSGDGTKDLVDAACAARSEEQSLADDDTIITSEIQSTGELYHNFTVRVATSPRVLVRCNNILVFALPVNGHKSVMEELAPHIIELIMEQKLYHQEDMPSKGNGNTIELQHERPLPIMHIIISSHSSLGAVYFMKVLREEKRRYLQRMNDQFRTMIDSTSGNYDDDDDIGIRITCWGSTSVTARKTSGKSVNVLTVREVVDFCTVPSSCFPEDEKEMEKDSMETEMISSMDKLEILGDGYSVCTTLFGKRFKHRKGGLLAISLSNLNPQNHLAIVLGNMSRMDPPPPPPPPYYEKEEESATSKMDVTTIPWYQGKNITPNIGRLMEALDRERIAIANALDIEVRTIHEHFSWSFHVPMETPVLEEDSNRGCDEPLSSSKKMRPLTVSEMNQQMHYYLSNDVLGPSTANSRYVIEDVPYGLALTVILGNLVNRPATLHEAGIQILSAMYGVDFMMENDLLQGLKMLDTIDDNIPSLDEWRKMAYNGYF